MGMFCGNPGIATFPICEGCLIKTVKRTEIFSNHLYFKINDVGLDLTFIVDIEDEEIVNEDNNIYLDNLVIRHPEKKEKYIVFGVLNPDGTSRELTSDERQLASKLLV